MAKQGEVRQGKVGEVKAKSGTVKAKSGCNVFVTNEQVEGKNFSMYRGQWR